MKKLLCLIALVSSHACGMKGVVNHEEVQNYYTAYREARLNSDFSGLEVISGSFFNDDKNECILVDCADKIGINSVALAYIAFRGAKNINIAKASVGIRDNFYRKLEKMQLMCKQQIDKKFFFPYVGGVFDSCMADIFWSGMIFSSVENGAVLGSYDNFANNFEKLKERWRSFLKSDTCKEIKKNWGSYSDEKKIRWFYHQATDVITILKGTKKLKCFIDMIFSLVCVLYAGDGTMINSFVGDNIEVYDERLNAIETFGKIACEYRKEKN